MDHLMTPDDQYIIERYEELRDLFDKMMVTFQVIKINTNTLYKNYIGLVLLDGIKYKLFYNHIEVETLHKRQDISVGESRVIPYLRNITEKLEMYLIHLSVSHTIMIDRRY